MSMKRMQRATILLGLAALSAPATGCALDGAAESDPDLEVSEGNGGRAIESPPLSPILTSIETARAIDRARQRDGGKPDRGARAGSAGRAAAAPMGGGPITVQGRVLQLPGSKASFLPVAIIGQGAALADANGNFTIPNVTTPYDVVIGYHDASGTSMVLYQGLTRADPRLIAFVRTDRSAMVAGTVSGGAGYPLPPDHETMMSLSTDHGSGAGGAAADPTTGDYDLFADWTFARTTTAHLTAVQYEVDGSGLLSNATGAAAMNFPISNGAAVVMPVALPPAMTTTIEGSYTYPAGYTFGGKGMYVESPSFGLLSLPASPVDSGLFSLNAPVVAGRSSMLAILALSPLDSSTYVLARDIPPGTVDLDLEVPEAVHTLFPFDGSTGVTYTTPFMTTDFTVGVHIFSFSSASGPTYYVMSADPVAHIPDLSSFAVFLPPSTAYTMSVIGIGPFADLDDFTGPTAPLPSPLLYLSGATSINFTTAP